MSTFSDAAPAGADDSIDRCMATHKICRQTAAYCIDQGGDKATLHLLKALDDCAEINLALANFLLRGSPHYRAIASVCRDIAHGCGIALAEVSREDPQLRVAYAAAHQVQQVCDDLLGDEAEVRINARDEAIEESFPASDPPPPPTEL